MWSTIFLVILAIVGAVSLVTAVEVGAPWPNIHKRRFAGFGGASARTVRGGVVVASWQQWRSERRLLPGRGKHNRRLRQVGFSADRQGGATTGETELQRNRQGQPSYTVRQKCVPGSSQIGSLPVFVTILTFFAILSIGLLTHATATGERDTARARIVIDLPNVTSGMVRLVNVVLSPGFVIGLGTYKEGKAVAANRWTGLNGLSSAGAPWRRQRRGNPPGFGPTGRRRLPGRLGPLPGWLRGEVGGLARL